ncbi:hypothetical protein PV371_26855 [Streptomyces sp. TX20-6-3]|uniref:hypothetical protein n=1 Tax=Streptomyces sp. TX20-6-3 TaxID=3028705 RepID=UPI0029BEF6D3|nr:hypothetical protein [Streptomyces sp. TX20-6-3]MDX2563255.1 hypothetical protein [Streptomyces sp. TX20-6-3]
MRGAASQLEQRQEFDDALAAGDRWQQQGSAFTGERHLGLGRVKSAIAADRRTRFSPARPT